MSHEERRRHSCPVWARLCVPDGICNLLHNGEGGPHQEDVLLALRVQLCEGGRRQTHHLGHASTADELRLCYEAHGADEVLIPHHHLRG